MTMTPHYDIAVIGLGAMGSATLYQLAKRGIRVIGLDRFSPPHDHGSTHGETRITRRAIGEGEAYVPLAVRSHEIWRELEAETGVDLLHEIGSIIVSEADDNTARPGRTGFIQRTIKAARTYGILHEILQAEEVRHRYPNLLISDAEIAYFEPGGGYLRPEACVSANLELARRLGAELRLNTVVQAITPDGDGVRVSTPTGDFLAGKVVVSAGGWASELLGDRFKTLLQPVRQVMHWFPIDTDSAEIWARSPVFMWPHGDDADGFFYGFPSLPGANAMKTADEFYGAPSDPNAIDRAVPAVDSVRMFDAHLRNRLGGISSKAVRAVTCVYTVSPDSAFVIDWYPNNENILVVSPCSGHGFKHSAAIGEAVAEKLVLGQSRIDLTAFSLGRFDAR